MVAAKVVINMHKKEVTVGDPPVTFRVFIGGRDDSPTENYVTSCPMSVFLMEAQSKNNESYFRWTPAGTAREDRIATIKESRATDQTAYTKSVMKTGNRRVIITRQTPEAIRAMQKKHLIFMINFNHTIRNQKAIVTRKLEELAKRIQGKKRLDPIVEEEEPEEEKQNISRNSTSLAHDATEARVNTQTGKPKKRKKQVKQAGKRKQPVMAADMIEEEEDVTMEPILFLADEWEALGEEKESPAVEEPDLGASLSPEQRQRFSDLIARFEKTFSKGEHDIGLARVKPVKLDTGDCEPINERPYKNPVPLLNELQRQINVLLDADIIEPSVSPWNSPSVLVPKKSKKYRLTINFKKLNSRLKKNAMAPPDIDLIMDRLGGMEYFTILDARSGFFHIPLDEESKEKTAFRGPFGHYQFKRLPQGLATAPALFQQVMNDTLGDLQLECAVAYMDDIIIFSRDFESHCAHVEAVFKRLEEVDIKISMDKSQFAKHEVPFLGRIIGRDGMKPDPDKLEAIANYPRPKDKKAMERFLGMTGYQKRWIRDYSDLTAPLRAFARNDKIGWGDEQEQGFTTLIQKLLTTPILQFPDLKKRFYLFCDASDKGLGVLLKQKDDQKRWRWVGCVSRVLNASEINYAATYKEALAIYYGVTKFQQLLVGNEFTVVTDHHSLCYLQKMIKPHGVLPRWIMNLMNFDFVIEWTSGKSHKEADALSRAPIGASASGEETARGCVIDDRDMCTMPDTVHCENMNDLHSLRQRNWDHARLREQKQKESQERKDNKDGEDTAQTIRDLEKEKERIEKRLQELKQSSPKTETDQAEPERILLLDAGNQDTAVDFIEDIAGEQDKDNSLKGMKVYLMTGTIPPSVKSAPNYRKKLSCYALEGSILCRKSYCMKIGKELLLPVIPHHLRTRVLRAFHDSIGSGHPSTKRMLDKMSDHVYWFGMWRDIENWCTSCEVCARNNICRTVKKGELVPLPSRGVPGEILQIDTMPNLTRTKSGNSALFVITDRATRFTWAFAARACNHIFALKSLQRVIWLLGRPKVLLSDGGSEYKNQWMEQFLEDFKIRHDTSAPSHPQTNGQTERMNATIISVLKKYCDSHKDDWDAFLDQAVYSINCSRGESTNIAPYTLMFGLLPPPAIVFSLDSVQNDYDWRSLRVMEDCRAMAEDRIERTQAEVKRKYDEKRDPFDLKVGDYVLVKNHHFQEGISRKLQECYSGPYRVTKLIGTHSVEIEREGRATNRLSKYGLKKFTPRNSDLLDGIILPENAEDEEGEHEDGVHEAAAEEPDEEEEEPPHDENGDLIRQEEGQETGEERDHPPHSDSDIDPRVASEPITVRRSTRVRKPPARLIEEMSPFDHHDHQDSVRE